MWIHNWRRMSDATPGRCYIKAIFDVSYLSEFPDTIFGQSNRSFWYFASDIDVQLRITPPSWQSIDTETPKTISSKTKFWCANNQPTAGSCLRGGSSYQLVENLDRLDKTEQLFANHMADYLYRYLAGADPKLWLGRFAKEAKGFPKLKYIFWSGGGFGEAPWNPPGFAPVQEVNTQLYILPFVY